MWRSVWHLFATVATLGASLLAAGPVYAAAPISTGHPISAPSPTSYSLAQTVITGVVTQKAIPSTVTSATISITCSGKEFKNVDTTDAQGAYSAALPATACPAGSTAKVRASSDCFSDVSSGTVKGYTTKMNLAVINVTIPVPVITNFHVPGTNTQVERITAGPDGNYWFTGEAIGVSKITPAGVITKYKINSSNPRGITTGPDGNLWFTKNPSSIGRITLVGATTIYDLPAGAYPDGITTGPDGNLWFVEYGHGKIGRITPNGTIVEYPLPSVKALPKNITTGPDGNLWFTEKGSNKIGRITPAGIITEYAVPTSDSAPLDITTGPDGNLWFTEFMGGKIGRITPNGTIVEYPLPSVKALPKNITTGPDGNLWFTDYNNTIGKITPKGVITEYPVSRPITELVDITTGPDGNLWFTAGEDTYVGSIGRVTLACKSP